MPEPAPAPSDGGSASGEQENRGSEGGSGGTGGAAKFIGIIAGIAIGCAAVVGAMGLYQRRVWRRRRFYENSRSLLLPSALGKGGGLPMHRAPAPSSGDDMLLPAIAYSGGALPSGGSSGPGGRGTSASVANPLAAIELSRR